MARTRLIGHEAIHPSKSNEVCLKKKKSVHFTDTSSITPYCTSSLSKGVKYTSPYVYIFEEALSAYHTGVSVPMFYKKQSILSLGAMENNYEICELELRSGSAVDFQDDIGYTAIMHAVRNNNPRIVRLLLDYKANPRIASTDGYSPLQCASLNGYNEIISLLLPTCSVNDSMGDMTCLMCACYNGHAATASLLLLYGADPFYISPLNTCAIEISVEREAIAVLRMFIKEGINIGWQRESSKVGLMYRCSRDQRSLLVCFLLSYSHYLEEFIGDLLRYPNLLIENYVLSCIRDTYHLNKSNHVGLVSIFSKYITLLLHYLIDVDTSHADIPYSLSAVMEAITWCLHCHKIVSHDTEYVQFGFFWDYVDTRLSCYKEVRDVQSTVLLLAMLEVYCLGCGSVTYINSVLEVDYTLSKRVFTLFRDHYMFFLKLKNCYESMFDSMIYLSNAFKCYMKAAALVITYSSSE